MRDLIDAAAAELVELKADYARMNRDLAAQTRPIDIVAVPRMVGETFDTPTARRLEK